MKIKKINFQMYRQGEAGQDDHTEFNCLVCPKYCVSYYISK